LIEEIDLHALPRAPVWGNRRHPRPRVAPRPGSHHRAVRGRAACVSRGI